MKRLSAASVFAFLAFPLLLLGQSSTTSLRGTVFDPQTAIVLGANVTLSNASTGFSQTTQTDDHGNYRFLQIPPVHP